MDFMGRGEVDIAPRFGASRTLRAGPPRSRAKAPPPRPVHLSAIDTPRAAADLGRMSTAPAPRQVTVRAVPIELCQFLKFGGLAESGGAAKQAVAERRVLVNGALETRKRRQLAAGDVVTLEGKAISVHLG